MLGKNGEAQPKHEDLAQAYMQGIGDRFRAARRAAGMTQYDVSEQTGVAQSDISKVETGRANPSALTLMRLAEGVGCRVEVDFVPDGDSEDRAVQ